MAIVMKLFKKGKAKKGGIEYTLKGLNEDGPVVLTLVVPRESDSMEIDDSRTITIANDVQKYIAGNLDAFVSNLDEDGEEEEEDEEN